MSPAVAGSGNEEGSAATAIEDTQADEAAGDASSRAQSPGGTVSSAVADGSGPTAANHHNDTIGANNDNSGNDHDSVSNAGNEDIPSYHSADESHEPDPNAILVGNARDDWGNLTPDTHSNWAGLSHQ